MTTINKFLEKIVEWGLVISELPGKAYRLVKELVKSYFRDILDDRTFLHDQINTLIMHEQYFHVQAFLFVIAYCLLVRIAWMQYGTFYYSAKNGVYQGIGQQLTTVYAFLFVVWGMISLYARHFVWYFRTDKGWNTMMEWKEYGLSMFILPHITKVRTVLIVIFLIHLTYYYWIAKPQSDFEDEDKIIEQEKLRADLSEEEQNTFDQLFAVYHETEIRVLREKFKAQGDEDALVELNLSIQENRNFFKNYQWQSESEFIKFCQEVDAKVMGFGGHRYRFVINEQGDTVVQVFVKSDGRDEI